MIAFSREGADDWTTAGPVWSDTPAEQAQAARILAEALGALIDATVGPKRPPDG